MPATPDPDLALRQAKAVADLYGQATARLLRIVARRLAGGIEEPGWAERKLGQVSRLRDEALAEVRRLQGDVGAAIADAIQHGREAGESAAAADLAELTVDVDFIGDQRRAVEALVRSTIDQVEGTHLQMVRSTLDVYRTVISEVAAPQVLAGVETRRMAAQAALNRFAARGVTGFVDRAGRRWDLESYAEMATRTAVGRAQVQGTLDRYADAGRDLVIVSDSPQECKACRPWEGKVLSASGRTPGYRTVRDATADGLFHANCRHSVGLYVPGLTRPMRNTADAEGDRLRQEQRYLERGVRRWKRVEAAALDDGAARSARAKAREWQLRLRQHVDSHELKRQPQRERLGAR